jgi:hypothetical protein
MSSPNRESLASTLRSAGHPPLELSTPGQGALLVLPFGGRVIGLFAEPQGENFFWVNPALAEAGSAKAFLAGTGWVHTGGDRTWVSPEVEFHVADLADPWGTYSVPRAIDPGQYIVSMLGESIGMQNRARVKFHRRNTECEVEIEKWVRLIANPLRAEPWFNEIAEVAYAGYELSATLRLADARTTPPISLWSLAVVPPTGLMIVPIWGETKVRDLFEPTGSARLTATRHAVHFLIDGREQHKISVRAVALKGRAGYWRAASPQRSTLVVRSFGVNPSGDYVDTPWDAPDEVGYAFQSYNGGSLSAFGELEYHTPAIGSRGGQNSCRDTSQLWAFSGPPALIRKIAGHLLGDESLPAAG